MIPDKFKAYDLINREWLSIKHIGLESNGELWYLQAWDSGENDIDPPFLFEDCGKKWEFLPYTGLNDVKGTSIYSGSVIEIQGHPFHNKSRGLQIDGRYVVRWDSKLLTWVVGEFLLSSMAPFITHIGYACENAELLEKENSHGN